MGDGNSRPIVRTTQARIRRSKSAPEHVSQCAKVLDGRERGHGHAVSPRGIESEEQRPEQGIHAPAS